MNSDRIADIEINQELREHQREVATQWQHHKRVAQLHEFVDIFTREMELFQVQPIPVPAISIEATRRTSLGHYVCGHDGLGIEHHINLNERWIGELSFLEQLEVLLHEMLHEWQEIWGKPSKTSWYHNREYCRAAAGVGLVVKAPRGNAICYGDPFVSICRSNGVKDPLPQFSMESVSDNEENPRERPPSEARSKLRKWVCDCVPPINLRVGKKVINVRCLDCGALFSREG